MASKAQFQNVFTFIMLAIVAGAALLLGGRFLINVLSQSCDIEETDFLLQLEQDMKAYASAGTLKHIAWRSPCDALRVCLVDSRVYGAPEDGIYPGDPAWNHADFIIRNEVNAPSTPPSNVFLVDKDGTAPLQLFLDRLVLEQDVLCIPNTGGSFRAVLEGRGRTILATAE